MYGIFPYIYHKNQPHVGNVQYMDGMGMASLEAPEEESSDVFSRAAGRATGLRSQATMISRW